MPEILKPSRQGERVAQPLTTRAPYTRTGAISQGQAAHG